MSSAISQLLRHNIYEMKKIRFAGSQLLQIIMYSLTDTDIQMIRVVSAVDAELVVACLLKNKTRIFHKSVMPHISGICGTVFAGFLVLLRCSYSCLLLFIVKFVIAVFRNTHPAC